MGQMIRAIVGTALVAGAAVATTTAPTGRASAQVAQVKTIDETQVLVDGLLPKPTLKLLVRNMMAEQLDRQLQSNAHSSTGLRDHVLKMINSDLDSYTNQLIGAAAADVRSLIDHRLSREDIGSVSKFLQSPAGQWFLEGANAYALSQLDGVSRQPANDPKKKEEALTFFNSAPWKQYKSLLSDVAPIVQKRVAEQNRQTATFFRRRIAEIIESYHVDRERSGT
jgi:hypothetical protein